MGAGTAQGDLGFYMMLQVTSPVILVLTAFAWLLERFAARRLQPSHLLPPVMVNVLSIASILMVGWNWFYLFAVWPK